MISFSNLNSSDFGQLALERQTIHNQLHTLNQRDKVLRKEDLVISLWFQALSVIHYIWTYGRSAGLTDKPWRDNGPLVCTGARARSARFKRFVKQRPPAVHQPDATIRLKTTLPRRVELALIWSCRCALCVRVCHGFGRRPFGNPVSVAQHLVSVMGSELHQDRPARNVQQLDADVDDGPA